MAARKRKYPARVERLEVPGPDGHGYAVEVEWRDVDAILDYIEWQRQAASRIAAEHGRNAEVLALVSIEDRTDEENDRLAEIAALPVSEAPGPIALQLRYAAEDYKRLVLRVTDIYTGEVWFRKVPPAPIMRAATDAARDFTFRSVLGEPSSPIARSGENGSGSATALREEAEASRMQPVG